VYLIHGNIDERKGLAHFGLTSRSTPLGDDARCGGPSVLAPLTPCVASAFGTLSSFGDRQRSRRPFHPFAAFFLSSIIFLTFAMNGDRIAADHPSSSFR